MIELILFLTGNAYYICTILTFEDELTSEWSDVNNNYLTRVIKYTLRLLMLIWNSSSIE